VDDPSRRKIVAGSHDRFRYFGSSRCDSLELEEKLRTGQLVDATIDPSPSSHTGVRGIYNHIRTLISDRSSD
jgi:hypothetical protein